MISNAWSLQGEALSRFHAYSLTRMRTMVTVVLALGMMEYVVFLAARAYLPQPLVQLNLHLGLLVALAILTASMRRVTTSLRFGMIGFAYTSLILTGFVLCGRGLDNALSWVMPAVMLVPVAAGPLWLTRMQYGVGTTLCWLTVFIFFASMSMSGQEQVMVKVFFLMNVTLSTVLHVIFYGHRLQNFTLEESLAAQASLDSLTGVLNRGSFLGRAGAVIARYDARGVRSSVLYMDLDRFKEVNDNHGHAAGDALLRKTAALLSSNMRDGDLFGRMGGEEFAMLIATAAETDALDVAERLRASVKDIERPDGVMSISIGVAHASPGETIEQLLNRADGAMLSAKRNGRDRVEPA